MYFGSVRFFKHLILLTVVLLFIGMISHTFSLNSEIKDLKEEAESLKVEIYEWEIKETYENAEGIWSSNQADSDRTEPLIPSETLPPGLTNEPPKSPYAEFFPELYAKNYGTEKPEENNEAGNYIYLTFDDGPSADTADVLKILRDEQVSATFFTVPREGTEKMFNKIIDEGHTIGVHSYSHDYSKIYASVEAFLEDFNTARNLIYEQTGVWSDLFRFPGGSINSYNGETRDDIIAEMTRRGFVYFDWNVDSKDSANATFDEMYLSVSKDVTANTELGNRSVVLFHDSLGGYTTWVLDDLIKYFKENKTEYLFGKIDETTRPLQW